MEEALFNELSHRIEGLAQAYLVMAAQLDKAGLVDAQLLQALLRTRADQLVDHPGVATKRRALTGLAQELLNYSVARRSPRQSKANPS